MAELTLKQKLFVSQYAKTGNGRQSAISAGYSEKSAGKLASTMLRDAKVIEAIAKAKDRVDNPITYDLKAAMAECDEQIEMARATENAAAFLGGVKLKAQLMKILDDKPAGAAFQIMISGIGGESEQKTVVSITQPSVSQLTGGEDENG